MKLRAHVSAALVLTFLLTACTLFNDPQSDTVSRSLDLEVAQAAVLSVLQQAGVQVTDSVLPLHDVKQIVALHKSGRCGLEPR